MTANHSQAMNTIVLLSLILVFQSFALSQDAAIESLTSFQTLYSFRGGADGIGPNGLVLDTAGNLYGTTGAGGETSCPLNGDPGCGVVFRLNTGGREAVLHRFSGHVPDQGGPFGIVILDATGNLYGTTSGLPLFAGTVFTVEKAGRQTVLYSSIWARFCPHDWLLRSNCRKQAFALTHRCCDCPQLPVGNG